MNSKIIKMLGILALALVFSIQGFSMDVLAEEDISDDGSDQNIDIDVEKVWQDGNNADNTRPQSITVELKNGDSVVDTLTISEDNDGHWKGTFENVPRYDGDHNEIQYTISEQPVEGYSATVSHGDIVSNYDYPTNVSNVELNTDTVTTAKVNVHGSSKWYIQPGLRTDFIEGTQVVFNTSNLSVAKATLTEYDAQGNLVPNEERVIRKTNSNGQNQGDSAAAGTEVRFKPKGTYANGTVVSTDHYFVLEFPNAVTVLDGTDTGSQRSVKIKIDNISVYKSRNKNDHRLVYGAFWVGPGDSSHGMGGQSIDMTFIIDGVSDGNVLLSFGDIDVTNDSHETGASRRESVYLADGFDKTIYTIPLNVNNANETSVRYTYFADSNGSMRAYSKGQDQNGTLESGFVTRALISKDGFKLKWTGTDCATVFFAQIKPFKLKVTVDENTVSHNGGTITEQGAWRYRDYGEPKVITITPDSTHHVKYLKIDGTEVNLDGFDDDGYMSVTTGYSVTDSALNPGTVNTGTEKVELYQRENGVIDVYLPAQYFAVNNTAPARVDHWIDTSFESNGLAENYTIKNVLDTSIEGNKTWISGNTEHVDNSSLNFTLKQKLTTQDDSEAVDYPFDKTSQMTWTDNHYVITGLPAYDEEGNKYEYLISETPPAGYDVTQNGNDFINTLKQEYVTVQGKKTWKDGGKTHNNAEEVIVTLKRAEWIPDLEKYGPAEDQDATPTWTGDTYKFENLPKYDDARYEYRYTVAESVADTINTDPAQGDYYECVPDSTGRNFVNTLKGTKTFSGTKTWLDGGKTHNNAEDLSLVLMRNTEVNTNKTQWTGSSEYPLDFSWDGNTFTYTNLPKYDDDGNEYNYSVRENRVMGKAANAADYEIYYDGTYWDFSSFNPPSAAYQVTGTNITNARKGSIVVSKTWSDDNNRDGVRPDSITVHLKNGDTEVGSATLSADSWSHTFTGLSFYDRNLDPIEYTVTEDPIKDSSGNVIYTPEYGDLTWNEDHTGCTIQITNTHEIETVDIPVEKKWVDGNDADNLRPDSITVQLYADGEKVDGKTLILGPNTDDPDKNWKGTFEDLPKNKENAVAQEITYTVKEVDSSGEPAPPSGYTNSYSTENGVTTITNKHITYITTDIECAKVMEGRSTSDNEFAFSLTKTEGPDSVEYPETASAPAAADGASAAVKFENILFKEAGVYKFTVKEVLPNGYQGDPVDGVVYDTHEYTVTVKVEVDGNGNALVVSEKTGVNGSTFTNTYGATGQYQPKGTKTLKGKSKAKEAEPANKEAAQPDTDSENNADISDGNSEEINDSSDGNTEQEEPAVEGNEQEQPAEVKAEETDAVDDPADEEPGEEPQEVESEVTIKGSTDAEEPDAEAEVKADDDDDEGIDMAMTAGQFKFEGRYADGDDTTTVVLNGENEAADAGQTANITFDTINYTTAGLNELVNSGAATKDSNGAYHISYVITEKAPNSAFQYNPQLFTLKVTITDDGKGNLSVTAEPPTAFAFVNRYITDKAIVPLDGLKHFSTQNGTRTLKAGDFSFTVTPENGAPAPEKTTAENEAGGAIHFGNIEFTKEMIGDTSSKTFTYTITEDQGDAHGVTYDGSAKTVEITVTDDGEGHLTATTKPQTAPLFEFNNTYEPDPVSETINADISVKKVLKGRNLKDGEFKFTIEAADDETQNAITAGAIVMPDSVTEANDADGNVEFGKITYNKAGTYQFTIREVIPDNAEANMRYDSTVYTVTVVVSDDENGHLTIDSQSLSDGGDTATFTNEYIPPNNPDNPDNPTNGDKSKGSRTGDDTNLLIPILLLIASAGTAIGVLMRRRRKA